MLRVTSADINGKSYDKTIVSADKLAEMFGINVPTSRMEFHLSKSLTHTDRFGQQRRAEGLIVKPKVSGVFNGNFVVIEYYERMLDPKTPGGVQRLSPRSINVTNHSRKGSISDAQRGREMAVLLALRSDCETSPFYKKGTDSRFRLYNPEVAAEARISTNKKKFNAWSRIHNGEIGATQLAIIAAGMGIKTKGQTFTEIKADLENKAAMNPDAFERKSDDRALLSLGLVKRCRDLNVIYFAPRSGKVYLVIDETLAEATGNPGLQILSGGYANPTEAQSALVSVLTRQDVPFIAIREMLELAEVSEERGNADKVVLTEERTSTANLFNKKPETKEEPAEDDNISARGNELTGELLTPDGEGTVPFQGGDENESPETTEPSTPEFKED